MIPGGLNFVSFARVAANTNCIEKHADNLPV